MELCPLTGPMNSWREIGAHRALSSGGNGRKMENTREWKKTPVCLVSDDRISPATLEKNQPNHPLPHFTFPLSVFLGGRSGAAAAAQWVVGGGWVVVSVLL